MLKLDISASLPMAIPLLSYTRTYKSVNVPKVTWIYCVDAVAVNLNHSSPLDDVILPFVQTVALNWVEAGKGKRGSVAEFVKPML
jgi:hypothetical protein